jgi:hypothetical protein
MSNLNLKLMKTKLLLISFLALALTVGLSAQVDPGSTDKTHAWTFDDGTANDVVGTAHGILIGDAIAENGHAVINAVGAWVELPGSSIGINAYSELSVSTWFTTYTDNTYNSGFHMIWYFGGSETDGIGGTAEFGSNGIFLSPARGDDVCRTAISCGNVAAPWTVESGVNRSPEMAFGDSTWHIVTTINAQYISLYINGALIDTANLSANNSLANLKNDFAWIGRGGYSGDPNYWSMVDEVVMYDKMLTADNVLWLYQNHIVSGINDIKNPLNVKIYSLNGNIYIQNSDNIAINSIQIFDMVGKLVYKTNVFQEVIDANLPSSVYIIRVQSNQGDYNTKISIE